MNRSLSLLIAIVNQAQSRRVVFCKVRKTKYMFQFLNILRQNNFIYGYSAMSLGLEDKITVYFRFHKYRPLLHGIRQLSKSGHRRYLRKDRFLYLSQKMDPGQIYVTAGAFTGGMSTLRGLEAITKLNYRHKCGELLSTIW